MTFLRVSIRIIFCWTLYLLWQSLEIPIVVLSLKDFLDQAYDFFTALHFTTIMSSDLFTDPQPKPFLKDTSSQI